MNGLEAWASNGWLKPHQTSRDEIANLFAIVEERMKDAEEMARENRISLDLQLTALYTAARTLAEIALRVSGFRVKDKTRHHQLTIDSIRYTLGPEWTDCGKFLDLIRRERSLVEYESVGRATTSQISDLNEEIRRLWPAVQELAKRRNYA